MPDCVQHVVVGDTVLAGARFDTTSTSHRQQMLTMVDTEPLAVRTTALRR